MYNKKKLNQLCNKEINIIFSEKGYGKRFHELQQKVEQLEKELNQEKEEYAGLHKVLNNKEEEFEKENYNNVVEISRLKRKVEQLENIRKEAIKATKDVKQFVYDELVDRNVSGATETHCKIMDLLNILNKGSEYET